MTPDIEERLADEVHKEPPIPTPPVTTTAPVEKPVEAVVPDAVKTPTVLNERKVVPPDSISLSLTVEPTLKSIAPLE